VYNLIFLKTASKEFKKLDFVVQKKIKLKLEILCTNPKALEGNMKSLKGEYSANLD